VLTCAFEERAERSAEVNGTSPRPLELVAATLTEGTTRWVGRRRRPVPIVATGFSWAAAQGRLLADQAKGPPAKGVAMTHHEHPNVTLVREGFAAFERGDMARMDQLLSDDVVWHVGGNSKWAGTYEGKAKVLEYFGRQGQATETTAEIHDIVGNDDHVVVLGSAKATARDGSSAEWKYTQIFHIRDGKTTEVWGMAENDAAVDPFLDSLPG
jgi:ketosteroid isomerase-like protein